MKNSIKIAALGLVALASAFIACNDADYDTLGVHAFVSESASNKSTKVTITELGADAEITACLSEAAPKDVKLKFVPDPEVLDQYNKKQASSFMVLPEDVYEFDPEVTIKAGEYSAPATKIHIKPLPKEYVGESYALPLRLVSADGSMPVTSVTSTYVITTEAIVVSSLPMFVGRSGLTADGFPLSLPQFTVEVRFQVSNTADRNRDVFLNGNGVLLRFEDPQDDTPEFKAHSLVQFQGDGWYLNPSLSFAPNKWQHLAMTYDGTKATLYVNGTFAGSKDGVCAPEFKTAGWFGGGDAGGGHGTDDEKYWAGCKILMSEARIWSVCRTEAQVQNNITTTSAKSEGLVAYWRFNEGEGNTFEDCTGNGHTLRTSRTPTWISDIKSTDTETPWP